MAFESTQVTLGSTATLIYQAVAGDLELWINTDSNNAYWIGGPTVDSTDGFPLFGANASNAFHAKVRPGDEIYGVTSSSLPVNVLVRSA